MHRMQGDAVNRETKSNDGKEKQQKHEKRKKTC